MERLIADGHSVVIVDNLSTGKYENLQDFVYDVPQNLRPDIHICDVRDDFLAELMQKVKAEAVIHLAAQISVARSVADPFEDAEINILGSISVFEAARKAKVKKVVYISSVAIYGDQEDFPVKESAPAKAVSPYGLSKKTAEDYLALYEPHFDWTVLRLGNVYGPRQDPRGEAGVVSIFFDRIAEKRPVEIFGDGTQMRDFVFVKDVAEAIVKATVGGKNQVLNVATGQKTTILELLGAFETLGLDIKEPKLRDPRENDIYLMVLDITKAKADLSWKPKTNLEAGLKQMLQYARLKAIKEREEKEKAAAKRKWT